MKYAGWIVAGVIVAGIALPLVLSIDRGEAPAVVLFFGRFHLTVVHFPIALLLVAAAIELGSLWIRPLESVRPAVPTLLAFGAVSGLLAVALGYMLSLSGGYDDRTLGLHLRLGLLVAVLSSILALAARRYARGPVFRVLVGMLAAGVFVTGHLGGTLARGSGYLTFYLPAPLKAFVGMAHAAPDGLIANIDSALVYQDLVRPILNRSCIQCHGPNKSKGDLRLDTPEGILRGGRDGLVVVAGNPAQSEIVRRIALPPHDEDAMPPDGGPPLDVGETELIRWWIEGGASFEATVSEMDPPSSAVETYLARVAEPRTPEREGILALDRPEADSMAIEEVVRAGLFVRRLSRDAPFFEIVASSGDRFEDEALQVLRPVAEQIAVLDLGRTAISDSGAVAIAGLPHLTHLHLQHTRVGDAGLAHLARLEYLEFLNLYGTPVTDAGLTHLESIPNLRSLYLWQTNVTEDAVAAFRQARPDVVVNTGSPLALRSDSTRAPR